MSLAYVYGCRYYCFTLLQARQGLRGAILLAWEQKFSQLVTSEICLESPPLRALLLRSDEHIVKITICHLVGEQKT